MQRKCHPRSMCPFYTAQVRLHILAFWYTQCLSSELCLYCFVLFCFVCLGVERKHWALGHVLWLRLNSTLMAWQKNSRHLAAVWSLEFFMQ